MSFAARSLRLIDLYTFNFACLGSRATGNDGGSFVVAGSHWHGQLPRGAKQVIRGEMEIMSAQFRTQLFDPSDIENAKKIQNQYVAQPLSSFLHEPTPAPAPPIRFIEPLMPAEQKSLLAFFNELNFTLGFCPPHPSETGLLARLAKIGVGGGRTFDATTFSPETVQAIKDGLADAWVDFNAMVVRINAGK